MNRLNEFKPCPICGMSDALELDNEHFFYKYKSTCLYISCNRCRLGLYVHGHEANYSRNYQILVGKLKEKWNVIKR